MCFALHCEQIKKEREAARRKADMREKEELRDRMVARKAKADKERCGTSYITFSPPRSLAQAFVQNAISHW